MRKQAMLRICETNRIVPFYPPVALTELPLLYHREHLFPYTSYSDTATTSVPRSFRMVALENEFLRIEIAPELGGRVYSLFDKRIDREILFSNPVVKPTRILPIWAFISGGMEFNFPIAHSPTSIAEVSCLSGTIGDYAYVRVGEREARTGMEWAVELGLVSGCPALVQRTWFRNRTGADHPWMSWTITAVRSTEKTEFIHPPHRVMVHDDRVRDLEWPGGGLNWDSNLKQMTALFWKPGSAPEFGVFHHDLGFGLMHLADPVQIPGKKVWTYGHGKHRQWGQATTEGGFCYAEIESGPLLDQSEKPLFVSGTERHYQEFWIPVHSRDACDQVNWPAMAVPARPDPWLGWQHSSWQSDWERFRSGEGPLPTSQVVTGIDLEESLRRELAAGNRDAAEPLALWLAFHGRPAEALPLVIEGKPTARRIAGLICWKGLKYPRGAVAHLSAGPLEDPVAVVELDELYAELGSLEPRASLLAAAPSHPRITERRADLALSSGNPSETIRLLSQASWPREHQRYVRTELWKAALTALGFPDNPVPETLNEDNLARFGAYWSA
jgi:hypothetical protein